MEVKREANTGTSFFAKLDDGDGGPALVDSLHPSLWLLQAPLAASYSRDFPTGEVKLLLKATSTRSPHLRSALPSEVLEAAVGAGAAEFDFFIVASEITRPAATGKNNVNLIIHPWAYPSTAHGRHDEGNWQTGAFTFEAATANKRAAGLPRVWPTLPKTDLAFGTLSAMRVSVHTQGPGMACPPNNSKVSLNPNNRAASNNGGGSGRSRGKRDQGGGGGGGRTDDKRGDQHPPAPSASASASASATAAAVPDPDPRGLPVRAFFTVAVEDKPAGGRPRRACIALHWWLLEPLATDAAAQAWFRLFDQALSEAQTVGELAARLTSSAAACEEATGGGGGGGDCDGPGFGSVARALAESVRPFLQPGVSWTLGDVDSPAVPSERSATGRQGTAANSKGRAGLVSGGDPAAAADEVPGASSTGAARKQEPSAPASVVNDGPIPGGGGGSGSGGGGGGAGLTKAQKKNLQRKRAREKKALAEPTGGAAPGGSTGSAAGKAPLPR